MPASGTGRPVLVRIAERISVEDRGYMTPCHIWQGPQLAGYGIIRVGSRTDGTRRMIKVHRTTYEAVHGEIPEPLVIDHLCRQTICCNSEHMEAVTRGENTRRGTISEVSKKMFEDMTHCSHGHEFTEANTYRWVSPNGYVKRHCRECKNRRWREMYQRRRKNQTPTEE